MINAFQVRMWLILFLGSLLLTPVLRGGEKMQAHINAEIAITKSALGERWSNFVLSNANNLFKGTPVSLVTAGLNEGIVTPAKQKEQIILDSSDVGHAVVGVMNGFLNDFIQACYVMCVRLLIVISWFAVLIPLIFAAIYDGTTQRIIKNLTFGSSRSAAYALTLTFVMPLFFAPLFYLTAPFTISPAVLPIWLCICLVPLSVVIAHSQPIFRKR